MSFERMFSKGLHNKQGQMADFIIQSAIKYLCINFDFSFVCL